jgi:uncharacterized delta-60 repeat protein
MTIRFIALARAWLLVVAFVLSGRNVFAGSYSNDFSAGVGAAVARGTYSLSGGELQLTPNRLRTYGALIINDLDPGVPIRAFTATFDLTIDSTGFEDGADGFSFNFGPPSSFPIGYWNYEQGVYGLNFCFSTYAWNGIFIGINRTAIIEQQIGVAMKDGSKRSVTISYNRATGASLTYFGQTINVTAEELSEFKPETGFRFLFGARCGRGPEFHIIDNVQITTDPMSTDASLANLFPSQDELTPSFSGTTTDYTVNVANAVTHLTLTPTVTQSSATVKVNGTTVDSGSASGNIALNVGTNVITLVVTAETGATRTYIVNAVRAGNADLASLTTSVGTFQPAFASDTLHYSIDVSNTVSSVIITPTVAGPNATVTVNGVPVASENPSVLVALKPGTNNLSITVTAEDLKTVKTYTLTMTRLIAELSDLVLSAGSLAPVFTRTNYVYTVAVPWSASSITVTPTAVRTGTTITVKGATVTSGSPSANIALDVGNNIITVATEIWGSMRYYTVIVTRAPSSKADLASLECSVPTGTTPAFSPGTINYSAGATYDVVGTFVRVIQADENARVEMRVAGGSFTKISSYIAYELPLRVGTNTVDWRVTTQDGTTTKIYTLTVVRGQPRHNNALLSLSLNNAALSPVFNPATNSYSVILPYYFPSTQVMATTPDDYLSTIEVRLNGGNYAPLASGATSPSLVLNVGTNLAEVRVTGEDGTRQIYSVTIIRNPQGGAGEVDLFSAGSRGAASRGAFALQPDQKIIVAGPQRLIERINPDGSLDPIFHNIDNVGAASLLLHREGTVSIGANVNLSAGGYVKHVQSDGTLIPGTALFPVYSASWLGLQDDGLLMVGGKFAARKPGSGEPFFANHLARLLPSGAIDVDNAPVTIGFRCTIPDNSVFPYNWQVYSMALQPDGKMVIGGNFTNLYFGKNGLLGTNRSRIRLGRVDNNRQGLVDDDFAPEANDRVYCLALQPDGKILLGGQFTAINGVTRNRVARLNSDGSLDQDFNPDVNSFYVRSLALQTDGRMIIGGAFTMVNGVARNNIARLNADGSLDQDFDPNANGTVRGLGLQADGLVLVAGDFTSLAPRGGPGVSRYAFARLNNDAATQALRVLDATQVLWTRGGSSPEISQVQFDVSTDGGKNWTSLGLATRIGTTPNWQITGINLPFNGQLRAWGYARAGEYNGSSSIIESATNFTFNPMPPLITSQGLSKGVFQFTYNSADRAAFTVLATTNLGVPTTNWSVLGTATNVGGTRYQFTDPTAGKFLQRFYQLRFP